jgi:predicted amidohydrolase YtcJ
VLKFVSGLNAMGITAWYDAGGRGMSEQHYEAYKTLADRGELNARAFWTTVRQPATPAEVDKVIAEIRQHTPFQGSDYFENIGWGESVYSPATTNLLRNDFVVKPEDMREVRRIASAIAESGMFLNAHVEMENVIDAYLTELEAVNKVEPIKGLRWVFSHLDQVTDAQLVRMKRLGIYAGLHSRPLIQGALMHKVHGERVQASGIVWGLGSDATAVTTSNPFYTLWFAVTGRMIGGRQVNRQTVSREEALIAHTRSNARFIFQESNLGSIQPGKYADLLVLDRDYFAVPAIQIKDIKPTMTLVGGKIVYRAGGKQ